MTLMFPRVTIGTRNKVIRQMRWKIRMLLRNQLEDRRDCRRPNPAMIAGRLREDLLESPTLYQNQVMLSRTEEDLEVGGLHGDQRWTMMSLTPQGDQTAPTSAKRWLTLANLI